MIDPRRRKRRAGLLGDPSHVAHHQSRQQGAAVAGEVPFDEAANVAAQIFDQDARRPTVPGNQFHILIAVEKAGRIDGSSAKIRRIIEAARVAAILRNQRPDPKPHPVAVAPVAPHHAQGYENIAGDLLRARRVPQTLRRYLPAGSADELLRFVAQRPLQIQRAVVAGHYRAQMMMGKFRNQELAMARVTEEKGQG